MSNILQILQIVFFGVFIGVIVLIYREWQKEKVINERLRLDELEKSINAQVDNSSLDDLVKHNNEEFGKPE